MLSAAPGLRVIATSREPLSAPAEHVVAVPPLDLPPAGPEVPLARLRQNDTVLLFAERAATASGRFELSLVLQYGTATAPRVRYPLDGTELAHIAAHGSFRADNPLFSSIRLDDGPLNPGGPAALATGPPAASGVQMMLRRQRVEP